MNKLLVSVVVLISILLLIKHFYFPSGTNSPQANTAKANPINVTALIIEPKLYVENIKVSGTLMANEEINLIPEVAGKVISIHFFEGQQVAKNQLLVKLNDAELQANKKKIEQQIDLLKGKETRAKQLLTIKGISQEEYDNIKNLLNNTEADLKINASQLDKTEIRAPFAGTIGLKNISIGAYVSTSTTIANLQQNNPIKIEFAIPERFANSMKPGNKIEFITEQNKKYEAKIYAVEPRINIDTRTLNMRAQCNNDKHNLLPGMFAQILIPLTKSDSTLLIPNEAIVPDVKGKKVFLIKNGKAVPQNVESGTRSEKETLIISGLKAQDTIITTGVQFLRPGISVNITNLNK